jgi:Beta-1,4-xylanase
MSHSACAHGLKLSTAFAIVVFFAALALCPSTVQSQTVIQNDFEDGTLQGWIPRGGGVVLTNTTEAAQAGTRSLKTTGRTQGFHGPSLNIQNTLIKGATYQVTVSVRLVSGQAPTTIRVTVQRTPIGGSNQFDTVVSSANNGVTDAAWTTLNGVYSFGTDNSGLLLYVEATTATASYYIDSFSITQLAPPPGPPPNTTGAASTFETGTREGWAPRIGDETLTVTTADAHSGAFSLLTSGRTSAFRGPAFNVTNVMFNGSRYRISLWAKLAPGEPSSQLRVSLQRNLGSVTTTFHTVVPNTTVTANGWVRLAVTYDLALANTSLTLYVESASGTPSFYIDDFQISFVPPPVAERVIPSVYQAFAQYFPIGAAVGQGDLTGEHAFLLTKHFNSITSENDMKWSSLQPTEGNFTYATADAQVSFANTNNMAVRGHTLIWHNQNPTWLFNDANGNPMTPTPENKALLLQRLENHIRAVMTHFGTNVYAWDVVNEVIDPSQADGFRRSPWFNITGTDYIERAFRIAHEVQPAAKLYINDFDTTNPTKRQFLFNLIADLKSRGVPIDGIGHQMHNNVDFPSRQAIVDTINMFANLGVDNQITELDVSIYSNSLPGPIVDYADIPVERFILQGYRYRTFFDAFRELQGKISSITFWGQADDHTWLTSATRVNGPLLFDTSLQKKFAYWGLVDPLQLPGADLSAAITASPNPVLSGHTTTYTITVRNNADNDTLPFQPSDDDLPATNVSLSTAVPGGTGFQSLTMPDGWTCQKPAVGASGQVQCTIPSLAAGVAAEFVLTVEVECATGNGVQIANEATVSSTTADPNLAPNNKASVTVDVSNPAPVISNLTVDRPVLSPPNHEMVDITLNYTIEDNCDPNLVPVITISSNQPQNGIGDGDTPVDWEVVDAKHVRLRAERSPHDPGGRIYTIVLTVTDSAGGSSSSSVNVVVPR